MQRDLRRSFVDDKKQVIFFNVLTFFYPNFHQFAAYPGNNGHGGRSFHRAHGVNGRWHITQGGFCNSNQSRLGRARSLFLFPGTGGQAKSSGEQSAEQGAVRHIHNKSSWIGNMVR